MDTQRLLVKYDASRVLRHSDLVCHTTVSLCLSFLISDRVSPYKLILRAACMYMQHAESRPTHGVHSVNELLWINP